MTPFLISIIEEEKAKVENFAEEAQPENDCCVEKPGILLGRWKLYAANSL
jgi:hypothetical protein